jgi:uncharacterized protein (TIGR00255 family)
MTGYGEAERLLDPGRLRVEIKTVNHRFFNTSLRTPPGFDRVESEIQSWVRGFISRGHVHIVVSLDRAGGADELDDVPAVDEVRARRYGRLLRELRDAAGVEGPVDLPTLLRYGDVLRAPEPRTEHPQVDPEELRALVEAAAREVVAMRDTEGARLRDDMEGRLDALEGEVDRVETLAPERLVRERDRLREAVAELVGRDEVDPDRLAREIAYLAEKWDINEEIVRFRSHLELFRETLASEAEEPVGKRLGFVVQELHREANTIGAKANDAEIARAAVAMKEEIERLREQVENVE